MGRALSAATVAARRGEVPVGAVVVVAGAFVAGGANRTLRDKDPSAHAEIVALRRAARRLGNHRLTGATLYVTLEPCVMCLGAIVQARVRRLVYAARDPKAGSISLLEDREFTRRLNHSFEVTEGVRAGEAALALRDFFRARRGRPRGRAARERQDRRRME